MGQVLDPGLYNNDSEELFNYRYGDLTEQAPGPSKPRKAVRPASSEEHQLPRSPKAERRHLAYLKMPKLHDEIYRVLCTQRPPQPDVLDPKDNIRCFQALCDEHGELKNFWNHPKDTSWVTNWPRKELIKLFYTINWTKHRLRRLPRHILSPRHEGKGKARAESPKDASVSPEVCVEAMIRVLDMLDRAVSPLAESIRPRLPLMAVSLGQKKFTQIWQGFESS